MSLFQCDVCGCVENTNLSFCGFSTAFASLFNWDYAPERRGKKLCSACGPHLHSDGNKARHHNGDPYGVWHNRFERTYLPLGMFITDQVGNLVRKRTGEPYSGFIIPAPKDGN